MSSGEFPIGYFTHKKWLHLLIHCIISLLLFNLKNHLNTISMSIFFLIKIDGIPKETLLVIFIHFSTISITI